MTMRMIDADLLMRDIEHYHLSDGKFQHWVEIQPTIERKTGKWIKKDCDLLYCSECDLPSLHPWPYCERCGAKMEE